MRLTERTDYALRALMVLAASRRRQTVPALARALGVSANHLTKVVQSLQESGWVTTTPGRGGGVELWLDPRDLTVGDVVRGLEPDLALVECMRAGGRCPLEGSCALATALASAREAFMDVLDRTTLGDLVHRRGRGLAQVLLTFERDRA